jgi:SagB-type dehydrogenase family enzyme
MKMHEEARRASAEKNAPAGEGKTSAPLFDPESLAVSLKRGVRPHETDGRAVLVDADGVALALPLPPETRRIFLSALDEGVCTRNELGEAVLHSAPSTDAASLYYVLAQLERGRWFRYALRSGGRNTATLEPFSRRFDFADAPLTGRCRLSRFVCLRREGDDVALESPLGHGRLLLHTSDTAALAASLSRPLSFEEMCVSHPALAPKEIAALLAMMRSVGALFPCDAEGRIPEDGSEPLRQWEFHDLLFHSRSRQGRHGNPVGGSCPFLGEILPLPGVKRPMSAERVPLHRPETGEMRADFFELSEMRRSLRTQGEGERALRLKELGTFLHFTGGVREILPASPEKGYWYEASLRPCAGSGAIHELEYYLTVARCDGLPPGLYRYDPLAHALERLEADEKQLEKLLKGADRAMRGARCDVLITLAARFQRVSWQYRSIAYSLLLKDVGAVFQQMYLAATALDLAPCALGAGDSDDFAETAGLDYFSETSVGEFALSGR